MRVVYRRSFRARLVSRLPPRAPPPLAPNLRPTPLGITALFRLYNDNKVYLRFPLALTTQSDSIITTTIITITFTINNTETLAQIQVWLQLRK